MAALADIPPASGVPRQVVLLCDGTNNNLTGQYNDTHVVKLCALLAADPDPRRVVFYDPGVGNPGELPGATTWDQLRRRLDRINGLAFGRGVYENMAESYLFLMRHYRPGDELYIIGFSRGAFTARSVAGLVNLFGILQPHMASMLPTLLHVYFASRNDQGRFDAISTQTTRLFSDAALQRVDIHFVGVWDTVASVGLPPFDAKFTALPTPDGKRFVHIRQAMALDEHRSQFRPRLYARDNGPFRTATGGVGSLTQLWFPGAHCDVGGGYPLARSALGDTAFAWLVSEAVTLGLRLRDGSGQALDQEPAVARRLAQLYPPREPPAARPVHSELLSAPWWALTGMAVRQTDRAELDDAPARPLKPVAHPSVAERRLDFATHSVWAPARTPPSVWCALLLVPLLALVIGQALNGFMSTGYWLADLGSTVRQAPTYVCRNLAFQHWQFFGWMPDSGPAWPFSDPWPLNRCPRTPWKTDATQFDAPRLALAWDLLLIAAYAWVLSWFTARAFARRAGLRQVGDPPRRWLNRLGRALPLAVFADLGEDLCTWLALSLEGHQVDVLGLTAHLAAAGLSVAKFVGLAGALVLVAAGAWPARASRP